MIIIANPNAIQSRLGFSKRGEYRFSGLLFSVPVVGLILFMKPVIGKQDKIYGVKWKLYPRGQAAALLIPLLVKLVQFHAQVFANAAIGAEHGNANANHKQQKKQ